MPGILLLGKEIVKGLIPLSWGVKPGTVLEIPAILGHEVPLQM